ncbi:unnamed protein product [Pleuronectes platessa]|uniref:Uncharacterized protein n=1 Tax=Pleuronectes platessa TaxID=8262 RepID=A0A9N7US67_PLEPL|nr:unnamed protein product [Pleuronectes platessa]
MVVLVHRALHPKEPMHHCPPDGQEKHYLIPSFRSSRYSCLKGICHKRQQQPQQHPTAHDTAGLECVHSSSGSTPPPPYSKHKPGSTPSHSNWGTTTECPLEIPCGNGGFSCSGSSRTREMWVLKEGDMI